MNGVYSHVVPPHYQPAKPSGMVRDKACTDGACACNCTAGNPLVAGGSLQLWG